MSNASKDHMFVLSVGLWSVSVDMESGVEFRPRIGVTEQTYDAAGVYQGVSMMATYPTRDQLAELGRELLRLAGEQP